jgi:cellulose 1,4-beta-cellobiosidase
MATAIYAVNTNPPTAVTLTGAAKKGGASLSWTASTSASGISGYRVIRNGVQIASVTTRTLTDKPTVVGTYDYTIVAVDGGGVTSSPSNVYRFTVASGGGGGGGKPPRR